jgi:hypothetical protein
MECQMTSGRDLFQRLRGGAAFDRPAFVPFLTGLAARAGCTDPGVMTSDAAQWTNCLTAAAKLFELDGVVAGYDPGLLALAWSGGEAAATAATQTALETMRRVFHACRQERMVAAALTGPLSLAAQLEAGSGRGVECADLKSPLVRLTEAVCEARPDLLLFVEVGAAPGTMSPGYRRLYQTLRNVASYFDIPVGLYAEGYAADELEACLNLGCDLYLLGPSSAGDYAGLDLLAGLDRGTIAVGLGLPLTNQETTRALIDRGLRVWEARKGGGLFFTVHEPTAGMAGPNEMHALVAAIDRAGREAGPIRGEMP